MTFSHGVVPLAYELRASTVLRSIEADCCNAPKFAEMRERLALTTVFDLGTWP
jgi:hypothetical protein